MPYIKDQPWFTSLMSEGNILGECPNCHKVCREHLWTLDDCYAVYRGRCPHCNALCLLGREGRGYWSGGMTLVLPYDEQIQANGWETDVPTRGAYSQAAKESR